MKQNQPYLHHGIQWVPWQNKKESGDNPDSFFVCEFPPRLHDTEETSCDTNYKEGKNDCDWRYFFLKQPHAKESKEKSHQSWDQ